MQFEIEASVLKDILSTVIKAVPSRPSHPILGNFLVKVNRSSLTISGFDLSCLISQQVDVLATRNGALCIPAKLFHDLVSKLNGTISISQQEEDAQGASIQIKCGKSKTVIRCAPPDDYPELPTHAESSLSVPASILLTAIQSAGYCMAKDETKHNLFGLNITIDDGQLSVAATDGHRMATCTLSVDYEGDYLSETVPVKIIGAMGTVLKNTSSEEVFLTLSESCSQLMADGLTLQGRILEGEYPKWRNLIPKREDQNLLITASRKTLIQAVETVNVVNDEKNTIVIIEVNPDDQLLIIQSKSAEIGFGTDEVTAQIEGQSGRIAVKTSYFIDALKAINSDEVQILVIIDKDTTTKPIIVKPLCALDATHMIMPIQLRYEG